MEIEITDIFGEKDRDKLLNSPFHFGGVMKAIVAVLAASVLLTACAAGTPMSRPKTSWSYNATYSFVLDKVERPEKASTRYGAQRIETVPSADEKYKYIFEDNLVRVLWVVTSRQIAFSLTNKTDHSIKIPWDEAAYVDETGQSHRVMHTGVKFSERSQPILPSVVVRGGYVEDIVSPTDYVYWKEGSRYVAGGWETKSLFPDRDFHYISSFASLNSGTYPSLEAFDAAVKNNVGKQIQVLLPLQIEDVINDYIFTFRIEAVTTKET